MTCRALVTGILLALLAVPIVQAQDMQRALRNYQAVMSGAMKLDQLSPTEQEEVLFLYRRMKATEGKTPECRDAKSRAQSAASDLSDYARRLRNCAEAQNWDDDCSTEMRRSRNAHSDYESAVSDARTRRNCEHKTIA